MNTFVKHFYQGHGPSVSFGDTVSHSIKWFQKNIENCFFYKLDLSVAAMINSP